MIGAENLVMVQWESIHIGAYLLSTKVLCQQGNLHETLRRRKQMAITQKKPLESQNFRLILALKTLNAIVEQPQLYIN